MGIYGFNLLGILIAAVAGMVVGMFWYSPNVFGRKWMKYLGMSKRKMKEAQEKGMLVPMLFGFVGQLLTAGMLSVFMGYAGAASIPAGLLVAFLLWLGFIATTQIGVVLWEQKPWGLYLLNSSYSLTVLLVMSIVLQLLG